VERLRTAVLISGRGSNLAALLHAAEAGDYPARIVLVVSDRAEAKGLEIAAAAGVPTRVIGRVAELEPLLADAAVSLVCLAGFMRVLPPALVERWQGRMLNIHPSLLPAFPGLDTHRRALAAGVRLSGCSVHFVTAEVDGGPIIGQSAVPVLPQDDEESLAARVLAAEHELYPRCLALVAAGKVRWDGRALAWDAQGASGRLANPA
jgi:formyltetrahydrofolate-dependent phosphoribosylglycinamide formyltransferase